MSDENKNYHILLATPCYGGQMFRGYMQSVLNLQRLCDSKGIKIDVLTIGNESLITRARNFYVSLMLAKKEYTHLLFVDADISFNPLNVLRMLTSNKDVVAGSYPKKGINFPDLPDLKPLKFVIPTDLCKTPSKSNPYFFDICYIII